MDRTTKHSVPDYTETAAPSAERAFGHGFLVWRLVLVAGMMTATLAPRDARCDPAQPGLSIKADDSYEVKNVVFSPDGRSMATVCRHWARLWDAQSGRLRWEIWHPPYGKASGPVRGFSDYGLAFSPDGRILAAAAWAEDRKTLVLLHDAATGKQLAMLKSDQGALMSLAFSPNGKLLAAGGSDGTIAVWNVAGRSRQATLDGKAGGIHDAEFSPDGQTLASITSNGSIQLWDVATEKLRDSIAAHDKIMPRMKWMESGGVQRGDAPRVAFSSNGRLLASCGGRVAKLWDAGSRRLIRTFEEHKVPLLSLAISPDAKTLVTGHTDGAVNLWSIAEGTVQRSLDAFECVESVAISPDGKTLAVAGSPGPVRFWDLDTRTERPVALDETCADCVAFSPTDDLLVTGGGQMAGEVAFWNPSSGRLLKRIRHARGSSPVKEVAFSGDGKRLLCCGLPAIVYDVASRSEVGRLQLSDHSSFGPADISPDGRTVVAKYRRHVGFGPDDFERLRKAQKVDEKNYIEMAVFRAKIERTMRQLAWDPDLVLWDVDTGKQKSLSQPDREWDCARFAPDGKSFALCGNVHRTVLCDRTGEQLRSLFDEEDWGGANALAFSRDGKTLASCGSNPTIRLWKIPSGKPRRAFRVDGLNFSAVEFSPDGRVLAAIGYESFDKYSERGTDHFNGSIIPMRTWHYTILWDTKSGKRLAMLEEKEYSVGDMAISFDGKLLAVSGSLGVRLYSMQDLIEAKSNGPKTSDTHGD